MANLNLDELEKLARAATPGPWEAKNGYGAGLEIYMAHPQYHDKDWPAFGTSSAWCKKGLVAYETWVQFPNEIRDAAQASNAEFIAAANPAVVLALIEAARPTAYQQAAGSVEAQRAAFEAWTNQGALQTLCHVFSLTPHLHYAGQYYEPTTELCWRAFQAGSALDSRAQPVAAGSVEAKMAKPWNVWGVAQRHDLADITDGAGKLITTMYAKSAREVVAAHNAEIAALTSVQPVATGSVEAERVAFGSAFRQIDLNAPDGVLDLAWAGIPGALWQARAALDSRAQPAPAESAADKFCDANCVWTDHAPGCAYGTDLAQPVAAGVDTYARQIAMALWRDHYQAAAPDFELFDDTYGVLSQIDNMLTGWKVKSAQPVAAGELPPLAKWIDDAKGKDPFTDDLIHEIETLRQQCATTAPWLTLAHTICADAGIPPGRIDDRLAALRDVLDSRPAGGATDPDQRFHDFLAGAQHGVAEERAVQQAAALSISAPELADVAKRALFESQRENVEPEYRLVMLRHREHEKAGRYAQARECAEIRFNMEQMAEAAATLAASVAQPAPIPLNEQTRFILGRPNFTCIRAAQRMREMGHDIATKAEDEQAAVIHLMLTMYQQHGDAWADKFNEHLRAAAPTIGEAK